MASRLFAVLAVVGGVGLGSAQLTSNSAGNAQELCKLELKDLCSKRTKVVTPPSVLLDVPDGCEGKHSACPVAFFLHGAGSQGKHTGKMFENGPHAVSALVHSYHFVGVYPTSDFGWNTDGDLSRDKCNSTQFDCTSDNNDVKFIWDIAKYLTGKGSTGRVYVYGATDGAALAQKLAANSGNDGGMLQALTVNGIWASGGQLLSAPERSGPGGYYNLPSTVTPRNTAHVAQAASHGTADDVVPYNGGKSKLHANCPECTFYSETDSIAVWAKHNGCDMSPPDKTYYPCSFGNKTHETTGTAVRHFYACPESAAVELWQIEGAPRGGAETFSLHYKDKNNTKMQKVIEFFDRVEGASMPPPPPPKKGIEKWIDDWAHDPLPYQVVTIAAVVACCVCMCIGAICSKSK